MASRGLGPAAQPRLASSANHLEQRDAEEALAWVPRRPESEGPLPGVGAPPHQARDGSHRHGQGLGGRDQEKRRGELVLLQDALPQEPDERPVNLRRCRSDRWKAVPGRSSARRRDPLPRPRGGVNPSILSIS